MRIFRLVLVFLPAVLVVLAAPPLAAAEQSFRTRYDASLFGLPIGRAEFESRFNGHSFSIAGRFRSAGFARIFDRTDGTVQASGRIGTRASQPSHYALDYRSGKKQKKTTIRFSGGAVKEATNQPERSHRGADWVPVSPDQLAAVSDPLSAMLLPAASTSEICNRTIRMFDGEIRADLVLEPAGSRESFRNAAVTCRARFVPVGGYRKGHSSIAYLRDRARILIGFQPVPEQNLYSPVEATVTTKIGTVRIKARTM